MTPYHCRAMSREDLGQVLEIERASFPNPWPASAYRYEMEHNSAATYIVLRRVGEPERPPSASPQGSAPIPEDGPILGYAGFWLILDEAHISTIAIAPYERGRGLALLLLLEVIRRAAELEAQLVTLEVRRSNRVAQTLYHKCGFQQTGIRRGYYSDNREDALILASPPLSDPGYQDHLQRLQAEMEARLAQTDPS